jgi:hypothetical protein
MNVPTINITSGGLFEIALWIILIAGFAFAAWKMLEMWGSG